MEHQVNFKLLTIALRAYTEKFKNFKKQKKFYVVKSSKEKERKSNS